MIDEGGKKIEEAYCFTFGKSAAETRRLTPGT